MIRPLRRRHLWIVAALALLLPVLVALALLGRRPRARMEALPAAIAAPPAATQVVAPTPDAAARPAVGGLEDE